MNAHDPRVQDRQDPALARLGDETRRISVIGAASAMSGAATSISRTCWTMWTEKSVVS